jgi:hypothetical protein
MIHHQGSAKANWRPQMRRFLDPQFEDVKCDVSKIPHIDDKAGHFGVSIYMTNYFRIPEFAMAEKR